MKRILLVALIALAAATSASADPLPSATEPNLASPLVGPMLVAPAQPEQLTFEQLQPIWRAAGQAYSIPWSVLAAINKVESGFGQNMGPSSAGAIGWMQFMPDTWASWGFDANGDGIADPWNAEDAIYSAARYLAATGGATDISSAVFAYNHAQWYVDEVLGLAQQYEGGGAVFGNQLDGLQQRLDAAKQAVVDANARLLEAQAALEPLQQHEDELLAKADRATIFSNRLAAQKEAGIFDATVQDKHAEVDALEAAVQSAQEALTAARDGSAATGFAPGAGQVLGAPAYSDGYVFPVAGGPALVSVGHTHHDYPAADIAAPEGSQVYALSDGSILDAWPAPTGNCGIGFTIATTDGLTWTYCHLSYLEPAVMAGAMLAAGQPVGLVGQTGHASGPHLHLQLEPATGYPQDETWFQSFAGTAFSWQETVQTNAAPIPVFAVVDGSSSTPASLAGVTPVAGSVVYFTATGA